MLIKDRDNGATVNIQTLADLSTLLGPSGSRQDHPDIRDWWQVRGDNVNDDRAEIQKALNAELAINFPPNRNFIVDGALLLRNFQNIRGAGSGNAGLAGGSVDGASKLIFTGTAAAGIANANPAASLLYASISGMAIRVTGTYDWAVDVRHPVRFRLTDVRVDTELNTVGGIRCQKLTAGGSWVNNWTQVEVHIPQDTSTARPLDIDFSDSAILGGHFSGGLGSMYRGTGVDFVAVRFDLSGLTGAGLTISHDTNGSFNLTTVTGCRIEENAAVGILIDGDAMADANVNNQIAVELTGNTFWNTGGALADIKLVNTVGPVLEGPMMVGNRFSLPEGALYVLKHVDWDPTRWNDIARWLPLNGFRDKPSQVVAPAGQTISICESGTTYTNRGATSRADFTLPVAAPGMYFRFRCADTDGLRVIPAGSDVIHLTPTLTSGAGSAGHVDSTTVDSFIEIYCEAAAIWQGRSVIGTWTAT